MRYAVTTRHRRGKLTHTKVVPADDPDDACVAVYDVWDMEERVITRVRKISDDEINDIKNSNFLSLSAVVGVTLVVSLMLVVVILR